MSTPEAQDRQLATLFRESTEMLEPDVAELVAGGVARGRTARRRRHLGTALGAIAVIGVVGLTAGVAGGLGGSGSPGEVAVADKPTPMSPKPNVTKHFELAVPAAEVPDAIAAMLPPGEVGPPLSGGTFPLVDEARNKVTHFRWDGTLTTFIIKPASSLASCAEFAAADPTVPCEVVDGLETQINPPTTGDQVTSQGVSVWRHGYVVTAMSYNAADGKDVPPLMDVPPISLEQLDQIVRSDVWFS